MQIKSREAASKIAEIILEIQEKVQQVVVTMQTSTQEVSQGVVAAEKSGKALKGVGGEEIGHSDCRRYNF